MDRVYVTSEGKALLTSSGKALKVPDAPMQSVTYEELKSLRDSGQLMEGRQYRITDYRCSAVQQYASSANHRFDIIVVADSPYALNESARACPHFEEIPQDAYSTTWDDYFDFVGMVSKDGKDYYCYESAGSDCQHLTDFKTFSNFTYDDGGIFGYKYQFSSNFFRTFDSETGSWGEWEDSSENGEVISFKEDPREILYFSECNLAAWELKYCLDNDRTRFQWATGSEALIKCGYGTIPYFADVKFRDSAGLHKCKLFKGRGKNVFYCPDLYDDYCIAIQDAALVISADGIYKFNEDVYGSDVPTLQSQIYNNGESVEWVSMGDGKGVIYYMKDEWNNECPYDFKNVMFKRGFISDDEDYLLIDRAYAHPTIGTLEFSEILDCYTFSMIDRDIPSSVCVDDVSVFQNKYISDEANVFFHAEDNVIKKHPKGLLPDNVFVTDTDISGGEFYSFQKNYIGIGCRYNTFGNECYQIHFSKECVGNTMASYCYNICFKDACRYNKINEGCSAISFGLTCFNNAIGGDCTWITFSDDCYGNRIDDTVNYVSMGRECIHTSLQSYSSFIELGSHVRYVNLNTCYCENIRIGTGVQYINITSDFTTSSNRKLKNVEVAMGTMGTSSTNRETLSVSSYNNKYLTSFGTNSSGVITSKCLFDSNS